MDKGDQEVTLLSGKVVKCVRQVITDLARWEKNAQLHLESDSVLLRRDEEGTQLEVSVGDQTIPMARLQVLDQMFDAIGGDQDLFYKISRFFHQGPHNDMVYNIMGDVDKKWKATLLPSTVRERSFHYLTADIKGRTIHKVLITIQGHFNSGALPDNMGLVEPSENLVLGRFYGATVVNLTNGTGYVRTDVQVYPKVWKDFASKSVQ